MMQSHNYAALCVALGMLFAASQAGAADPVFQKWLQGLWPQAQAFGVSRATFEAATNGVEPDLTLPDLDLPGRDIGRARRRLPADGLRHSTRPHPIDLDGGCAAGTPVR